MIPPLPGPVFTPEQLAHQAREPKLRETLELARELEMRRCRIDHLWFLKRYWTIQLHKTASEAVWENMYPCQEEILRDWATEPAVVTLKARQIGYSTAAAGFNAWDVAFHPNTPILFLSRREDDAVELLDKAKFGFDRLPLWMANLLPKKNSKNKQELLLDNNSAIVSLPSKSNAARSRSARRLVADEFAFFEDPDEALASMRPVTEGGGSYVILSTANGVGNAFERLCMTAYEGNPVNYKFTFQPWSAVPDRDEAWYKSLESSGILPWVIAQEYPTNVEEAFLRSGNAYFDREILYRLFQVEDPERGVLVGV